MREPNLLSILLMCTILYYTMAIHLKWIPSLGHMKIYTGVSINTKVLRHTTKLYGHHFFQLPLN